MTQTRSFLLILWLSLAGVLYYQWTKEQAAPAPVAAAGTPAAAAASTAVPGIAATPASSAIPGVGDGPMGPAAAAAAPGAGDAAPARTIAATLHSDVLHLAFDAQGERLLQADLIEHGNTASEDATPVRLLDADPARFYIAQAGLSTVARGQPELVFAPEAATAVTLADGAERAELAFVARDEARGLEVRRIYALERGSYAVQVRHEIRNAGDAVVRALPYRMLWRDAQVVPRTGMMNADSYSFQGAGWYTPESNKLNKRKYDDFIEDGPLDLTATGGWISMLQHHFMSAWIPPADEVNVFSLGEDVVDGARHHYIRAVGAERQVAPGETIAIDARLWVGPKLQEQLDDVAPGLSRTLDYGIFTILAKPMFWLLSVLHDITGNWGWAIVLLVLIIKLLLFKLSEAQYKSFARMRAVQPRIEALKERYGDDRQKFQMAMMDLYKKEKINPVGGCLPILLQIPIFIALYWVLLESVELRHAVWIPGWIDNLTAKDPYFILPVLNAAAMWATQKLTPAPGMDPMQRKIMQMMPLAFGVMFAFFPAGLVLYWVTNGLLGLAQQVLITRLHGDKAKPVSAD
jgi:YidC/Oxa1 family membrane protein insertase